MDTFYLLIVAGQKTGAVVPISRCCQVGKGAQVFAFRVIPGIEKEDDDNYYDDLYLSTFPCQPLP